MASEFFKAHNSPTFPLKEQDTIGLLSQSYVRRSFVKHWVVSVQIVYFDLLLPCHLKVSNSKNLTLNLLFRSVYIFHKNLTYTQITREDILRNIELPIY